MTANGKATDVRAPLGMTADRILNALFSEEYVRLCVAQTLSGRRPPALPLREMD